MDPLIAAQVYTARFCPLTRLPEELLLCIIDFLSEDILALHCLRIVSRIFLRLLGRESVVWRDMRYREGSWPTKGEAFYLHDNLRLQFQRLIQRDGRCDNCRRWNDNHECELFDDCKFQQGFRKPDGTSYSLLYRKLHCYACHGLHDVCQFSSTDQHLSGHQAERRCLGQQGSVQLCEHVQIPWAKIKAHVDDWRQQQHGGEDWQACLDSFSIECHDASHDMRCTSSELPTWPRARLGIGASDSNIVVLNLEWAPHIRMDAIALTADGRIPAPEIRAWFQGLRRLGPTDTLCPPCRPGALPEMAFFSPSCRIGHLLYYKTGEDDEMGAPPAQFSRLPPNSWQIWNHGHGTGENGTDLDIQAHYPSGADGTGISCQCLVVSYEKDIMICETTAITDSTVKIVPTDHWLHAMDTRTYPHPQASHIRPQCRDSACTNYYRRRRDYYVCPKNQNLT